MTPAVDSHERARRRNDITHDRTLRRLVLFYVLEPSSREGRLGGRKAKIKREGDNTSVLELIVRQNPGTAAGRGFSAYPVARDAHGCPRFLPTFADYNIITYNSIVSRYRFSVRV